MCFSFGGRILFVISCCLSHVTVTTGLLCGTSDSSGTQHCAELVDRTGTKLGSGITCNFLVCAFSHTSRLWTISRIRKKSSLHILLLILIKNFVKLYMCCQVPIIIACTWLCSIKVLTTFLCISLAFKHNNIVQEA